MSSGTAGSVHLLGARLNLAHIWEASRSDLVRVLGTGESKVSSCSTSDPRSAPKPRAKWLFLINALYTR